MLSSRVRQNGAGDSDRLKCTDDAGAAAALSGGQLSAATRGDRLRSATPNAGAN
jgi:hypothetical protein